MHLPKRDMIATGLVAIAVVLYLLWAFDAAILGLDSTRSTGIVVLALGFAASASAVVPGFEALIHGNKAYLAVTGIIGLAAFVAGIVMLVAASDAALGVLIATMCVLWLIATVHHIQLAPTPAGSKTRAARGGPGAAGIA